jgi:hypothetical protein
MTTATTPAPAETTCTSDVIAHVYCCDPDTALCGHDIRDMPEVVGPTPNDCIVCLDLHDQPCPRCGYTPEGDA